MKEGAVGRLVLGGMCFGVELSSGIKISIFAELYLNFGIVLTQTYHISYIRRIPMLEACRNVPENLPLCKTLTIFKTMTSD